MPFILRDDGGPAPVSTLDLFGFPTPAPPSPSAPPTSGGAPPALPTAPIVSATPLPGQGIALDVAGKLPTSVPISGAELSVVQKTSNVTVSATTEGTATTVLTADTIRCDGSPIIIDFIAPQIQVAANAAGNFIVFVLYEDGSLVGTIGDKGSTSNIYLEDNANISIRKVPAQGSRTYSIRAWRTNADCTVVGGPGGVATRLPMFVRITRA